MARREQHAAPADDGGHRGSFTTPLDEMVEPSATEPREAELQAKNQPGTDSGLMVTLLMAVLGLGGVFAYCSLATP